MHDSCWQTYEATTCHYNVCRHGVEKYEKYGTDLLYYSDGSLPVEEACKILIKNNISSAPVYDSRNNHNGKVTEYVGMFDYGDVIAYILLVLMDQMPPHMQEPSGDDDLSEVTDLIRRAVEGQSVPVRLASGK